MIFISIIIYLSIKFDYFLFHIRIFRTVFKESCYSATGFTGGVAMLKKVLKFLGLKGNDMAETQEHNRKHIRHPAFHAEAIINGQVFALRDWSMGGVFFETMPDARIAAGDTVQMTLKFRFLHGTVNVQQIAHITRTMKRGIAAEFAPFAVTTRRQMERVLDSFYTQSCIESQVA